MYIYIYVYIYIYLVYHLIIFTNHYSKVHANAIFKQLIRLVLSPGAIVEFPGAMVEFECFCREMF